MVQPRSALIIGASRGLGWGLAREFTRQDWSVIATVRDTHRRTALHSLQAESGGALEIERVDITKPDEIAALRARLLGRRFDLLFVAAGVTNDTTQTIGEVATDEFVRVMVTNALSPLRVIEQFLDLVTPVGQVAVMSSELGSVTDNTDGGWEVYRASKASLNTLMRCLVARRTADTRTYYVIAPGWVRTDMGGPSAPLDIDTSVRGVIYAMRARVGTRGLVFVDYRNELLPW
jgi:NAD(P)-dependent dehydrogenase (short-subunit alcohol dehydrogenase family)